MTVEKKAGDGIARPPGAGPKHGICFNHCNPCLKIQPYARIGASYDTLAFHTNDLLRWQFNDRKRAGVVHARDPITLIGRQSCALIPNPTKPSLDPAKLAWRFILFLPGERIFYVVPDSLRIFTAPWLVARVPEHLGRTACVAKEIVTPPRYTVSVQFWITAQVAEISWQASSSVIG